MCVLFGVVAGCAASARATFLNGFSADRSTQVAVREELKPITFKDWVREYADVTTREDPDKLGADGASYTVYTVKGRPGKKAADTESKWDHKCARWAISDKVDFDGAVVVGADFKGVKFLNGFTAKKARFEMGASFKVGSVCL